MGHTIPGVELYEDGRGRHVHFREGLALGTFSRFVAAMQRDRLGFGLFDPKYPSPSDPGAHFRYHPQQVTWQMTLGNHGWSGGVYTIQPELVAKQLHSLYKAGLLEALDLDNVFIAAHYGPEPPAKNAEMIELLERVHA